MIRIGGGSCVAQDRLARDSSQIITRSFNQQLIKSYKANPDFRYEVALEPSSSLWDRFWYRVWSMLRKLLVTETGGTTFKWGIRVFAVIVIAFFIWQLTKMRASGLFSSKASGRMAYTVENEDIHSIDFSKEINQAITEGDYRLAVRLLYLQSLKKLSDSGLISWRIDKTNLSYLAELKQADLYPSFRRLTIQFENNWYGNIPIGKDEYESVSDEFQSLNNSLGR